MEEKQIIVDAILNDDEWKKELGRIMYEAIYENWERLYNPIYRPVGLTRKDLEHDSKFDQT